MAEKDLIILLADLDVENALRTLLVERHQSLQMREIAFDTIRHVMRDSGCCRQAGVLLRPYPKTHHHALIAFDRHGSGMDALSREEIERYVEQQLVRNGWQEDRVACVVFDPELEIWVWGNSPHVANILGWSNLASLNSFLSARQLRSVDAAKPTDPKNAMLQCLREARKPRSARLFSELAEQVSLRGCHDESFRKFTATMQHWFPES